MAKRRRVSPEPLTKEELVKKYKTWENYQKSPHYRKKTDAIFLDNYLKHLDRVKIPAEEEVYKKALIYYFRNHTAEYVARQLAKVEQAGYNGNYFDYNSGIFVTGLKNIVFYLYGAFDEAEKQAEKVGARGMEYRKYYYEENLLKTVQKKIKGYKHKPKYIAEGKPFRAYISRHFGIKKWVDTERITFRDFRGWGTRQKAYESVKLL